MLKLISRHLETIINSGRALFGPRPTHMWMSSLDTATGCYPEDDTRPAHIPRRHYRAIDAPCGCSLYWDQSSLIAAHALSKITKNSTYQEAADAYVQDFLKHCIAENGVFLWGNHYFWNAFQGQTVRFVSEEEPVPIDFSTETGDLHEVRPIPPAWELFKHISLKAVEQEIRTFTANSIFDKTTGGFNRHADGRQGCGFLESGGILVEALAWLHKQIHDHELAASAETIADFSFKHRHPITGLLENNPTKDRWDKHTSTTEIGLWAGSIIRAAESLENSRLLNMAIDAVKAYLKYGWDSEPGRLWGRLNLEDGSPILGASSDPDALLRKHQPGDYADYWRPLFPAHDYPLPFAETCLALWQKTDDDLFKQASLNIAKSICASLPAGNGKGAYAEHYGRAIHFLNRCAQLTESAECRQGAKTLTEEAVHVLHDGKMFRSHPGEHRYDAVDGVGYLLLALLAIETGDEPDMLGSGW